MKSLRKMLRQTLKNNPYVSRRHHGRSSYSQCGEDLILEQIFTRLKISQPRYLDIGAYHPIQFSNTYRFYLVGGSGVCVEANAELAKPWPRFRPNDTCLNVGASVGQADKATFFILDPGYLSTFSENEASEMVDKGQAKLLREDEVSLRSVDSILADDLNGPCDLLSLDVEGLDYEILKSMELDQHRPRTICVETVAYDSPEHDLNISEYLNTQYYRLAAQTPVNSIFVDRACYE